MSDVLDSEIGPATVSGICPETGEPYTILAGEAYTTPSGDVIDSAGFADTQASVDDETDMVANGEPPAQAKDHADEETQE